ncbi:TonB-dependent receptor plug domain-containing protein [Sphingomonas montanisoli]|uniref:TonB-dependent receptor n=1 Tax=Sphingomonas montanisoli TaxID=2606412 RepID=A0A5D9C8A5_9SPHN|nr:TonB-dependent receptor [Sphingomonas montanisoli]TZG27362.1 TonB-dependent receptor [Sphingomonas montanisoli]
MKRIHSVSLATVAVATLWASAAMAQSAPADAASDSETIIVTGTRTTGFKASDSPAPIQVLGSDSLKRVGQTDMIQTLAQQLPSVQAQAFGSDQAAFHPSIKLRGLNPNHTLILIDGKRRHGTSSVVVTGGPFGGNAAADISLIPQDAIERVEVLQDGAAAQYGTDAIAGVVNFILKHADHGGSVNLTGGKYFDQGGQRWDVMGNVGFAPFEDAYVNVTAERQFKNYSFRGDLDPRVVDTGLAAAANTGVNGGRYNINRFGTALTGQSKYPEVNQIAGDGRLQLTNVYASYGWQVSDDIELYGSSSYSKKIGKTWQNYRLPVVVFGKQRLPNNNFVVAGTSAACRNNMTIALCPETSADIPYPAGFRPQEKTVETDYSVQVGAKGEIGGTHWDITSTYGNNLSEIYVTGSANAALYYDSSSATSKGFSPTSSLNGEFIASQWTNTLDLAHDFDVGFAEPITVAAGLEYRREVFQLKAGDEASYYTGTGVAQGGIQSFFGYSPANASRNLRHNFSQYIDIAAKPLPELTLDGAVRHEHYDDFGDTTIFKATGRYDISPAIAVRGTVSTGFRAPTLAEGFYSGINVSVSSLSGIFAPNSPGAAALGIAGLKPEKSTNFSGGWVFKPIDKMVITIDAYSIKIKDRIVRSSSFLGYSNNCRFNVSTVCTAIVSPSVVTALRSNGVPVDSVIAAIDGGASGSVGVNAFVNGITSLTRGIDFLTTYSTDFDTYGKVDWSLAANYNVTKVTKVNPAPGNINQRQTILDVYASNDLTNTTPKFRATAGAYWTLGNFTVNLRESYYGNSYAIISTPNNGLAQEKLSAGTAFITDLELGYQIAEPLKLSIGANNLFNKYPNKYPQFIRDQQYAISSTAYITKYPTFSPYGINGGYYYGRIAFKF